MSDVPVTRHFNPVFGNLPEQKTNTSFSSDPVSTVFCDWLSIYQDHTINLAIGVKLPLVNNGAFVSYDLDGEHEFTTLKKLSLLGSHETKIFIRCDGSTVWFEGNVSRFGRPDNIFGYDFLQCIKRINAILATKGLPPFTAGKRLEVNTPTGWKPAFTGARITRVDLTQNFAAGSSQNAAFFMRHIAMQQASRLKTGTHGEGETVDFGRGSKRVYSKAYLKAAELIAHSKKTKNPASLEYIFKLSKWADSIGLVRFETTYKSTFLIDNFYQYLGAFDMQVLTKDFTENRQSVFTRSTCEIDQLTNLDKKALSIYRMWQAGDNLQEKFSRTAFYVNRKLLLPYGIDIAIRSNVVKFEPRVRIIKLEPIQPPDFYVFDSPTTLRLAA